MGARIRSKGRKMKSKYYALAAMSIVAAGLNTMASYATNDKTTDEENSAAEVRFYEPSSCSLDDSAAKGKPEATESYGLSTLQMNWIDKWHSTAENLSIEFGIPWEAVMAQSIVESAAGTSTYAVTRNNFFGLGAVDSNPDNAYSYESPEAGWRGYYEFIQRNTSLYSAHGVFDEPTITNPYKYIEAVKAAGYATASDYVEVVSKYIELVENRADDMGWDRSADLASAHSDMLDNAKKNRSGKNTGISQYIGDGCSCSGDSGATNIRWQDGFLVTSSLTGYNRVEVIGSSAESKISSNGYGLSFDTKSLNDITAQGPDKLTLRTVAPNDDSTKYITDAYALYPNGNYPHFAVDIRNNRVYQFFSASKSAAALDNANRTGGLVVDIIGYLDDDHSDTPWNLNNENTYSDSNWTYAGNLLKAIHEEYAISLAKDKVGGDEKLWDAIKGYITGARDNGASKCANLDDENKSLESYEAKRIANAFNKASLGDYNLPNGKSSDVAFVAYFVQRFTNLDVKNRNWGYGRDVAYLLQRDYPMLGSGTDPKPLSVYSVTTGSTTCAGQNCGRTGVVVGIKNGIVTTIETDYSSSKARVETRPISYFKNSIHPQVFTYLTNEINEDELTQGRQGN